MLSIKLRMKEHALRMAVIQMLKQDKNLKTLDEAYAILLTGEQYLDDGIEFVYYLKTILSKAPYKSLLLSYNGASGRNMQFHFMGQQSGIKGYLCRAFELNYALVDTVEFMAFADYIKTNHFDVMKAGNTRMSKTWNEHYAKKGSSNAQAI